MHAFVEENFGLIINRYRRQTGYTPYTGCNWNVWSWKL